MPPRDLAATITARSVLRAGWAVAFAYLGICVILLIDLWIERRYPIGILLSLASLLVVIVALLWVTRRPSWQRAVVYLAVGTAAAAVYDLGLLAADPSLNQNGIYLLNRVTIALLLVGAVSSRLIHGVVWCAAGCLAGSAATMSAQLALGLPTNPGFGPVVSLAIYLTIIVMFWLIRRSQRRFAPDFSAIEVEVARMAGQRELESTAISLLHDTVLNDLAAVVNGKDAVDDRARARFLRDVDAVAAAQRDPDALFGSAIEGQLRIELLAIISEFRWRGLTVEVSGGEALSARISREAAAALVGAVGGCLENIVRHSGSDSAEVFIDASETTLSTMIVDHGRGFDPTDIPDNRLGIRRALVKRIEGCGGRVRIWSAIGAGTSVVISVPIEVDGV
ncbi:hypothetical protein BKA04_002009 [Cryobacterium mesophilum]|uniref:Histidine kinase/HSP90-like ATPase domain-containing protein n=1 Tax=Terrimesophilobacter mesophilus TaxID=433647 RepID=A0A4R8VB57_9MICO|nr:ATP-binding protein [Terrimesophilobacter mesophilus]MBB5633786.1 hypothetical protein [Terrimesophilobacter mesophilus]TFB80464.1 hypothetical protein E3N84_10745 [Terrimesophilobacter mesophilus]